MFHANRPIALVLLLELAAAPLYGCRSSRLKPTLSQAPSATASAGQTERSRTALSQKHPPRDSEFSVYNNPAFGVSFRYPRNYSLEEDIEERGTLLTQERLDAEQPGSFLFPMVVIPPDAYPNTTFAGGSLQFVINSTVTEEACRSFASPRGSDWPGTSGTTIVHGIPFQWREHGYARAGSGFENREYAGFSRGTCYEFFLEVVSVPDDAMPVKEAKLSKIFRPLEKIVESLEIRSKGAPRDPGTVPIVHSFLVAPCGTLTPKVSIASHASAVLLSMKRHKSISERSLVPETLLLVSGWYAKDRWLEVIRGLNENDSRRTGLGIEGLW